MNRKRTKDEEIESEESDYGGESESDDVSGGSDNDFITPDQERLARAKRGLSKRGLTEFVYENIRSSKKARLDSEESCLHDVADDLIFASPITYESGRSIPTCVVFGETETALFSGSKDCVITRWDIETGKRTHFPGKKQDFKCGGHHGAVLALAVIPGENTLISAGEDRVVRLWDVRTPGQKCFASIPAHRASITGILPNSDEGVPEFITVSQDKRLLLWSLSTRRMVSEHLGHTAGINSVCKMDDNRPLTGSTDTGCRMFSIEKKTHLMFSGAHLEGIDAVASLSRTHFAAGSQDGSVSFWSSGSKVPVALYDPQTQERSPVGWISSLVGIRDTNCLFVGRDSGHIDVVNCNPKKRCITRTSQISMPGWVNSMAVSSSKRFLVAVAGQEHKFGRWHNFKDSKNCLTIVPLKHAQIK